MAATSLSLPLPVVASTARTTLPVNSPQQHAQGQMQGESPAQKIQSPSTQNPQPCVQRVVYLAESTKVEDFPTGYPRFAALLATHPSFQMFRKFSYLRTRMLLNKQDELVRLEEQLQDIDKNEPRPLYRTSLRKDKNERRQEVFRKIKDELVEYDDLLQRTENALRRPAAMARDATNVKTWIRTAGQPSDEESIYLESNDLSSLGVSDQDPTYSKLEGPIEDAIIWASGLASKVYLREQVSRNPLVHVFPKGVIEGIARCLMAILLLLLLFVPVVVSISVRSVMLRIFASLLACSIFILALSMVTKARTAELFVAGATYSALLVVYITGAN